MRTRWYYVHDADSGALVHEANSPTSADALDWAEAYAERSGKTLVVSNDEGRSLARFGPDGDYAYLGH